MAEEEDDDDMRALALVLLLLLVGTTFREWATEKAENASSWGWVAKKIPWEKGMGYFRQVATAFEKKAKEKKSK